MKRVLLTGAGGFLGSHLLPKLADAGFSVIAISSQDQGSLEEKCATRLDTLPIEVIATDDQKGIAKAMLGIDVLVNCGFPRGDDGYAIAHGLEFISWLFQMAAVSSVGAVVNVSSQSVYDQHRRRPAVEDDPVCPVGDYAIAKYATELMLEALCAKVPHTSVRLASLIGPGFNQRVVNKMVSIYFKPGRNTFFESGNRFGFMDVRDAADGLKALCLGCSHYKIAPVYNLGAAESHSISEMAQAVWDVMDGFGYAQEYGPYVEYREQTGLLQNTSVKATLFAEHFGWQARYALYDSVIDIARTFIIQADYGK